MNNLSQIIKQHNKNVFNKKQNQTNPSNCRNKNDCPLDWKLQGKERDLQMYCICNVNIQTTRLFKLEATIT